MSSACRSRMHDVCRGYTDGHETYRCECRCHDDLLATMDRMEAGH